jgi:hypothetical protein
MMTLRLVQQVRMRMERAATNVRATAALNGTSFGRAK